MRHELFELLFHETAVVFVVCFCVYAVVRFSVEPFDREISGAGGKTHGNPGIRAVVDISVHYLLDRCTKGGERVQLHDIHNARISPQTFRAQAFFFHPNKGCRDTQTSRLFPPFTVPEVEIVSRK